jgi:predicted nucleic acid-binding protein
MTKFPIGTEQGAAWGRAIERYAALRRLLTSFGWAPVEAVADFEGAAAVYRSCRQAGFSPRGLIDCMIANIAMRTGSRFLAADTDFARMATVVPLRIAK